MGASDCGDEDGSGRFARPLREADVDSINDACGGCKGDDLALATGASEDFLGPLEAPFTTPAATFGTVGGRLFAVEGDSTGRIKSSSAVASAGDWINCISSARPKAGFS
jgi:hypothetical protein